ncbi:polysaccharide pyruvyl transferase family protein [Vibrio harveyi]|uniref:polysaccharide pyruvyl transferase family protein n=1 Tax=Vibrio harveyi TaxID=669 RepID=UPI0036F34FF5
MKIAIITHPLEKNIGGIMQAYALQKVLSLKKLNVQTIDFRPWQHNSKFRTLKYSIKNVLYRLSLNKHYPLNESLLYSKNKDFIKDFMVLSDRVYSRKSLKKYVNKQAVTTLIVGSDQTWRPKYITDLVVYYLGFVDNCKKLAYASSFGVSNWEYNDVQEKIANELIKNFHRVSVREDDGVKLCQNHLHTEAVCVADPTLLLDKSIYLELCEDISRLSAENYLFYYVLDNNQDKQAYAESLAESLNLQLLTVESKPEGLFLTNTSLEIGPKEWLSLFKNSSYVITDSYHGMVFSLKFQRQFLIFGNPKRGLSRFSSLLNKLELNERIISSPVNGFEYKENAIIDYSKVDVKIDEFVLYSEDFLFGALSEVKNPDIVD